MSKPQPSSVLSLSAGQAVRCNANGLVRVVSGRVWVTRTGDPDDHFLDPGQALPLWDGGRALIGAEGPAQVVLELTPESRRTLAQRLSRTWAALRSRTIAAWTFPPTS